ncbi:hypothetical protein BpHYR1_045977 [Brachionus plicatilis]|uniref:Uncharacterized protein n=1 Tax=Brachionus plicatilis TaxID=10195 RepID=A0A3M7T6L0_BRAPC|nr:hypothetical protein BpHYR1_045977 [Brachionus plicatilis]
MCIIEGYDQQSPTKYELPSSNFIYFRLISFQIYLVKFHNEKRRSDGELEVAVPPLTKKNSFKIEKLLIKKFPLRVDSCCWILWPRPMHNLIFILPSLSSLDCAFSFCWSRSAASHSAISVSFPTVTSSSPRFMTLTKIDCSSLTSFTLLGHKMPSATPKSVIFGLKITCLPVVSFSTFALTNCSHLSLMTKSSFSTTLPFV